MKTVNDILTQSVMDLCPEAQVYMASHPVDSLVIKCLSFSNHMELKVQGKLLELSYEKASVYYHVSNMEIDDRFVPCMMIQFILN